MMYILVESGTGHMLKQAKVVKATYYYDEALSLLAVSRSGLVIQIIVGVLL